MSRKHHEKLGEILLRHGAVSKEDIERALERNNSTPGRLGEHLLDLCATPEDALAKALSEQSRLSPYLPEQTPPNEEAVALLPKHIAKKHNCVPVGWEEKRGHLTVVVADPVRLDLQDEIRFASGAKRLTELIAPKRTVDRLFARLYEGAAPEPEPQKESEPRQSAEKPKAAPVGAGRVLVADLDRRRARAVSALLEASGYEAVAVISQEEAVTSLARGEWALWVNKDFPKIAHPSPVVFDDPGKTLEDCLGYSARVGDEARALMAEVGQKSQVAEEFLRFVRFLGEKADLAPLARLHLELKAARMALGGYDKTDGEKYPGAGIMEAARVYFGSLAGGASRRQAFDTLRATSASVKGSEAVLRWALGTELIQRAQRGSGQHVELAGLRLADLVEMLSATFNACKLRLSSPSSEGELSLMEGRVVDARTSALIGKDAFLDMLSWQETRFLLEPEALPDVVTIENETVRSLISQAK